MDEEELVCRPDLLACMPPADHSSHGGHDGHDHTLPHAIHGAELAHGIEHGSHGLHSAPHSAPRAAPGSGGPHDPEFWIEVTPARGRDLDEIMGGVGAEAVREEATLAPTLPRREPLSDDMAIMLEDMARASESPNRAIIGDHMDAVLESRPAGRVPRSASTGDPMYVPGPGEDVVWPPMDGAADGVITRDTARVGETWSRRGGTGGDFFAEGDPSIESRALAPRYSPWGTRAPDWIGTDTEYSVAREFPVERSVAAPWFAEPGGADQVRAPMSAGSLESGGYLEFERSMSADYATASEIDEITAAVRECGDADDLAALDDMELAPAAGGASMGSRLFGGLGAIGGMYQLTTATEEVLDGDLDMGAVDGVSGGLGAYTGLMTLAGEGAAIAPPVALAAGLAGAVSAGHHYNVDHETFGRDAEGNAMSSIDFALACGLESYDSTHDWVAEAIDGGEYGGVGDYVGSGVGGVAALLGGLGGGLIGLGGDLRYGVPEVIGGAYDLVTGYGDAYCSEGDLWGDPTVDPETGEVHHVSSREMVEDSAHGTFDAVHDGIMGLTGNDGAMGVVGEVLGTTAGVGAGALVGLGGGIVGLAGALGGTIDRGVSDLWSWMTD